MNEESFSSQVTDFMDMMGFEMPTDHLHRICSVEKTYAVLTAIINCVHPMETARQAKCASLYSKLLRFGQNNDGSKPEELEHLKTRIRLIEQLKHKKIEITKKKETCTELVKENHQLLQKIQWMNLKLNEENKKLLFLTLNKKALDVTSKSYCCLRRKVSELVLAQKRKLQAQTSINLDGQVTEALNECLTPLIHFWRSKKEKMECVQNMGCENGGPNITAMKGEILEHVIKKLENLSWPLVFQALLEMLRQQIYSVQSLLNSNSTTSLSERHSMSSVNTQEDILERIFMKTYIDILSESLQNKSLEALQDQVELNSQITTQNLLFDERSVLEEKLKVVENQLQEVDMIIQEKISECKNIKTEVIGNLEKMCKSISLIKHLPKKIKLLQKDEYPAIPQLTELLKVVNELYSSGVNEIKLFAKIPLVAIEKLTLANKKVPIYEFASSYLKVISVTSKYSLTYPSWMKDSTSLALDDLLIHVWQQLSFLCLLCKTHSLMKPFIECKENMIVLPHSLDEDPDKMERMYENFRAMISTYESNVVNVQQLLIILKNYPFNSIVPRDLLVDGLSIEYFEKLLKSDIRNESLVCYVAEDTCENSH